MMGMILTTSQIVEMMTRIQKSRGTWFDEPKVIVSVRKLAELLGVCMLCAKSCDVEGRRLGAALTFTITCQYCMHTRTWSTCDMIGKAASINALLAAAVLFTGSLPAKSLRLLSSLKVCVPTVQTLHYYQRTYLHQIIRDEFSAMKINLWKTVRGPVVVAGDGRCDTAGHSAIYGLYSLMDCETNFILSAKLVTEVSSSNAMELEGLKRCHGEVLDAGLSIRELVTDRHKTVNAFVAKNLPSITHTFDPWHIAKGLKTKMLDIGKIVSLRKTLNWIKPVVSHVYHCAEFSPLNSPLRLEMWKSVLSHLQDIHEFPANMHYKECPHDDLSGVDGNGEIIDWLLKGGKVYQALTPVVHKKDILEAVMRASSADTAALESYHAELNRNAPKMSYFSYSGMQSRIQLTVMHHNENVNRPVIINKDGTVRQQIVRKKITKQQQTSIPLRVPPTYAYRDRMFLQFESYLQSRTKPIPLEDIIPPTLASTGSQLTREEVISRQKSRPGVIRKPHHVTMATTEANRKRKMKATSAAAKKILVAAKTTKRGTARKSRVKKTATSKVLIIPKKKAKKR
ncbi:uncharacterized protein [Watersipora subatra]|uniref:uncharacterized protein n=1 Tax=Watersipora subatra TaxID=2589382 RepID=UPI00355BB542